MTALSTYEIKYLIANVKYERLSDLADHLNISLATVSKELKRLRSAGLIEYYSIAEKKENRVKNCLPPFSKNATKPNRPIKNKIKVKSANLRSKYIKSKYIISKPIEPVIIRIHTYTEWKKLSKYIKMRDNYTCKECGITEENALKIYKKHHHVHHIIPYAVSKDDSPENLITLCVKCHQDKHPDKNILTNRGLS